MTVDDAQRARVRAELPEVEWIEDADLAARVVEAWALALSQSSFSAIADIRGSGNPDTPPLETERRPTTSGALRAWPSR